MLVTHRDLAIIELVARFSMLPSGSIRKVIFPEHKSATSSDRALNRLVERKYLERVSRRMIGGNGGASGMYIYRLGTQGRKIVASQATSARLADIHHTVAVADTYTDLLDLERLGELTIIGYATEPDSWCIVGGSELRPDLHTELGYRANAEHKGYRKSYFIEVDLGTERQKQLKEKLKKYSDAWKNSTADDLSTFPLVLFLVPNDARVTELKWLISKEEDPEIFEVIRQDQLSEFVLS